MFTFPVCDFTCGFYKCSSLGWVTAPPTQYSTIITQPAAPPQLATKCDSIIQHRWNSLHHTRIFSILLPMCWYWWISDVIFTECCNNRNYVVLCPAGVPCQCAVSTLKESVHWGQDQALKFSMCCVTDWTTSWVNYIPPSNFSIYSCEMV